MPRLCEATLFSQASERREQIRTSQEVLTSLLGKVVMARAPSAAGVGIGKLKHERRQMGRKLPKA
jgi:hypothetical protein